MPKKNGFFLYMCKRKTELESEGRVFPRGLAEVSALVDQEWRNLSDEAKEEYKDAAKGFNENIERKKLNQSTMKKPPIPKIVKQEEETEEMEVDHHSVPGKISMGEELAQIRIREQLEKQHTEDVRNTLNEIGKCYDCSTLPIILISFSKYPDCPGILSLAEVAMCVFSIKEGIYDAYTNLIDPGPVSEHNKDFPMIASKLAVPVPSFAPELQNYQQLLKDIFQFINGHSNKFYGERIIYCMAKDMEETIHCMISLFMIVGSPFSFKVLPIEGIMQIISTQKFSNKMQEEVDASLKGLNLHAEEDSSDEETEMESSTSMVPMDQESQLEDPSAFQNAIKEKAKSTAGYIIYPKKYPFVSKGIFFDESHVTNYLDIDNLANNEELACLYHQERGDGVYFCPMNIVNRYAFCLLDVLVLNFKVPPIKGRHYPTPGIQKSEHQLRRTMLQKCAYIDYPSLAKLEKKKEEESQELKRKRLEGKSKSKMKDKHKLGNMKEGSL